MTTSSTPRRVLGLLGSALGWGVAGALVLALAAAVLVPRLVGATPYTVLTGSMQPSYPPGTLVVVKPVDPAALRTGDVVTYQLRSGEPTVVTHRIVGVGVRADGKQIFTTRGDANSAADPKPVLAAQIRGRLWYAAPHLGRVNQLLDAGQRQIAVSLAAAGLLGYAALMLLGAARDRRRSRRDAGTAPADGSALSAVAETTQPAAAQPSAARAEPALMLVITSLFLFGLVGHRRSGPPSA